MQATTTTRHFVPGQFKQAALAVALLASTAIGVTVATIVRDTTVDSGARAAIVSSSPANRPDVADHLFMEQNLYLPTGGALAAENLYATNQFIEQNLSLPTSGSVAAVNRYANQLFIEQNLSLPASVVTTNRSMIEENSWGQTFAFATGSAGSIYPSADDVVQPDPDVITY